MARNSELTGAWPANTVVLLLFFVSGFSALVYEVLWMKELGLLFGNTSHAMATTLAAFFLGLAAGSHAWGKRAANLANPLSAYGWMEFAVAISVTGYFIVLAAYHRLYPALFDWLGDHVAAFTGAKFFLALVILFPPAFFMGGTLPVMSQFFVRDIGNLGKKVSLLYAVNTLGAATGAFLAGFYFPMILGYANTYRLAMGMTVAVAAYALLLGRRHGLSAPSVVASGGAEPAPNRGRGSAFSMSDLRNVSFLSGTVTLTLQVLWTRMFAQVLQNSVYTFSVILVVFLLFLAMGAWLANRLMSLRVSAEKVLFTLLVAGALLVGGTPFMFTAWTDGLNYVGTHESWAGYVFNVFGVATAIMGPPLLLLGAVFPSLVKLAETHEHSAGRAVGRLTALNTLGAIFGSLLAGFVLLDFLGLWASIRLVSVLYLLAALYLAGKVFPSGRRVVLLPALGILLLVSVLDTTRLPSVRVDPVIDDESLLELWEGSAGTVAAIRRGTSLKIKVNNFYTLGGTGSRELEALEGYLPLLLHRAPYSVYMIGLGTGITAGATLEFPIKQLVVTELLADVVTASSKYFGRYTNDLFFDPRARVIIEDGRNYLKGTREAFDVITGDLFVPWKAGAGSLYTVEHFRSVARRLNDGGVFMQWLPAYQLSHQEFAVIARTMLEVFPQVTAWRGDFSALKPIVGLLGQNEIRPLAPDAMLFTHAKEGEGRVPLLAHYVGNLNSVRPLFAQYPLNRDDRPVVEFQAPIAQRMTKAGELSWLAGEQLIHFMDTVSEKSPFESDPYLSRLRQEQRKLPMAGLHLHKAQVLRQEGRLTAAKQALERWRELSGVDE